MVGWEEGRGWAVHIYIKGRNVRSFIKLQKAETESWLQGGSE